MGTLADKKALQKKSNILLLIAILGFVVTVVVAAGAKGNPSLIGMLFMVRMLMIVPWFWGLGVYAESKGYSGVMGICGILSIIGLIILAILPDKYVLTDNQVGATGPSNYYRPPAA